MPYGLVFYDQIAMPKNIPLVLQDAVAKYLEVVNEDAADPVVIAKDHYPIVRAYGEHLLEHRKIYVQAWNQLIENFSGYLHRYLCGTMHKEPETWLSFFNPISKKNYEHYSRLRLKSLEVFSEVVGKIDKICVALSEMLPRDEEGSVIADRLLVREVDKDYRDWTQGDVFVVVHAGVWIFDRSTVILDKTVNLCFCRDGAVQPAFDEPCGKA